MATFIRIRITADNRSNYARYINVERTGCLGPALAKVEKEKPT